MNIKRIWAVAILFGMCTQVLCGCGFGRQESAAENRVFAGVAYYNQSDTFVGQLIDCLRKEFDKLEKDGFEVTMAIRDAAGSQQTQDDQVKELMDAGCNILFVNLVDRTDPSEIIEMAMEHDVPIIFFNREPVAEDMMRWDSLYYVGADAKQSGVMEGEIVVEAIQENEQIDRNKDGKIQYVILEGEAGHQDAIIRTENAVDTLKNHGIKLEKLSSGIANWNRAQAQNRMMQMIGQYQNKVELVLANNDDMALGAIDAYKKLNYTESALPVFFGVDGTDDGLKAVVDLELSGTVYNDKEGQAAAMAGLAAALISRKGMENIEFQNEKYIYLPYAKVTSENVREFFSEKQP